MVETYTLVEIRLWLFLPLRSKAIIELCHFLGVLFRLVSAFELFQNVANYDDTQKLAVTG